MSSLQTYSDAGIWKITLAVPDKQLAGPTEVSVLKLSSAGGGAAFVTIYDSFNLSGCTPTAAKWILDTSSSGVDTTNFPNPLRFKKGVYAVCEDGAGLNPQLAIATIPSSGN